MRIIKAISTFLLIVFAIISCSDSKEQFQISDLEGEWYDVKRAALEEWKVVGKNHLKGKGFEVNGADTNVFEILEIKEINGTITFLADVEAAMGQGIVDFPLVSRTKNGLVFINKEHDYPQVLSYEKISADSLKVTVGKFPLLEDKEAMVFHYVRNK